MLAPLRNSRARSLAAALLAALACAAVASAVQADADDAPLAMDFSLPPAVLAQPPEARQVTADLPNGTLVLYGRIDSAMRTLFDAAIAGNHISKVQVTSEGGDALAALQIANTMLARGMDVEVRDLCFGACAQYLFIAGRQRHVDAESVVGFMGSIRSMADVLGVATDTLEVQNPLRESLRKAVALEADFYQRRGVSDSLLLQTQAVTQPTCVTLRRGGGNVNWIASVNYLAWVPSGEFMKSVGVDAEGDWPITLVGMQRRAGRFLLPAKLQYLRYGDLAEMPPRSGMQYSPQRLKDCVLDEVPRVPGAEPG